MMLMAFIFLLELGFSFLPNFVGELTTIIAKLAFAVTDEEVNAKLEIKDLKEEQGQLSITDDFARYARLQRKVDKLMASVKDKVNERKQQMSYLRMGVTVGIYVLHAVVLLLLMYFLRSEPIGYLPSEWLFPFSKAVAIPTGIPGAIGLGCWIVVSNTVIHRTKALVGV